MKEIHYRILTIVVLAFGSPLLKKLIITITQFQIATFKFFRQLVPVITKQTGFQIPIYLMDLFACVFWPLLLTIAIDIYYKKYQKTPFKSPNLLLLFLWFVFNTGTFLLR